MFTTQISKEQVEELIQLTKEGFTAEEIIKTLGLSVTRQRIQQILAKNKVDVRGLRKAARERIEAEKLENAAKKWGKGYERKTDRDYVYSAMRAKFRQKKHNCHQWEWSVQFSDIDFPQFCPILGLKLDYFAESMQENSPSFDRLDPTKGYIKGNVYIISQRANRIKNDGTPEEHKKIYEWMLAKMNT